MTPAGWTGRIDIITSAGHRRNDLSHFPFLFFRHHTIFKDVYRQVGMLQVPLTCLQRFSSVMKLKLDGSNGQQAAGVKDEPDRKKELG